MSRLVPSFSEHIKPRARIVSLAIVIENPDGELVMVRPDDIEGFTLDVETHWESIPYASKLMHQTGRLEMSFKVLGIMKTRPADIRETEGAAVGVWLPGMEYEVLQAGEG